MKKKTLSRHPASHSVPGKSSRRSKNVASADSSIDGFEEEDDAASKKPKRRSRSSKAQPSKRGSEQSVFIDEEKGELKPFGRESKNASRRNAKVNEFDARKNKNQQARMVRMGALTLLGIIAALSLKQTFLPPKQLTAADVSTIVDTTVGDTGFPIVRGQGFAENFMSAYLNINNDNVSSKALTYFYTGNMNSSDDSVANSITRSAGSNFNQKVLYGPTVYKSKATGANTASYTIGALVAPSSAASGSNAKWDFFNVNVYYDSKSDAFYVTPESPTVTSSPNILDSSKLPQATDLGTGQSDDALNTAVSSVVTGYIKGYATSTVSNHSAVDQYISGSDPSLVTGLGGHYTLQGDDSTAITFQAYPTTADPNEVKVSVKVLWTDSNAPSSSSDNSSDSSGSSDSSSSDSSSGGNNSSVSSDQAVTYTSTYVMTLDKGSDGKYLITKFAPLVFVPKTSD